MMRALRASGARWLAYGLAAAFTAAAMVWVNEGDEADTVLPTSARTAATSTSTTTTDTRDSAAPLQLSTVIARPGEPPLADPFAASTGITAEQAAQAAVQRAAPPAPRAPMAPALPFSFLGRWKEQGKSFVFLQRGDRSYKIDGPGALDADYAVQSIDEQQVTLKYLPLGTVQDIRLDAPTRAPQRSAARAAEPNADEPQVGN